VDAVKVAWRAFSTVAVCGPAVIVGVVLAAREWPAEQWLTGAADWLVDGGGLGPGSVWFWVLAVAGAVVVASPLWSILRYAETLVHEMGHAYVAGMLGALPARITIEADHSGLAQWRGHRGRLRNALATFSGYPWPVVVGCGAVLCASVGAGRAWVVWAAVVAAVTVVGMARNALAVCVSVAAATLLGAVVWLQASATPAIAVLVGLLLIDAGVRSAIGLLRLRDLTGSDPARLRQLVFVPARLAAVSMAALIAALIAVCGWVLVASGK
jgi:hypothetical protein